MENNVSAFWLRSSSKYGENSDISKYIYIIIMNVFYERQLNIQSDLQNIDQAVVKLSPSHLNDRS